MLGCWDVRGAAFSNIPTSKHPYIPTRWAAERQCNASLRRSAVGQMCCAHHPIVTARARIRTNGMAVFLITPPIHSPHVARWVCRANAPARTALKTTSLRIVGAAHTIQMNDAMIAQTSAMISTTRMSSPRSSPSPPPPEPLDELFDETDDVDLGGGTTTTGATCALLSDAQLPP